MGKAKENFWLAIFIIGIVMTVIGVVLYWWDWSIRYK